MNIKNRLSNLENRLSIANEFCACKDTPKNPLVLIDATENGFTEPRILSEPEICQRCKKPVDLSVTVLMLTDTDAEIVNSNGEMLKVYAGFDPDRV